MIRDRRHLQQLLAELDNAMAEEVQQMRRIVAERFVDRDFFHDGANEVHETRLRRGARVRHERFGEGKVLSLVSVGEPAVVAFFPGWGEKKILARFLKLA